MASRLASLGVLALLLSATTSGGAEPDQKARAVLECEEGKSVKPDAQAPPADLAFALSDAAVLGKKPDKKLRIRGASSADDPVLRKWLAAPGKDPALRRTLDLTTEKSGPNPERRYHLHDCFPTHFKPGKPSEAGATSVTEITVVVNHIEPA